MAMTTTARGTIRPMEAPVEVSAPPIRVRASVWRVALVVAMMCFWEGFPFSIMGFPMVFGYQLYAALCFGGLVLYVGQCVAANRSPDFWDIVPFVLFAWCIAVSAYYNAAVVPQPLAGWLPAVFTVGPLLTILLFRSLGVARIDVETGLFWAGLIGSALVIVATTFGLHFLDIYARGSAFSAGRIVLLKLPAAFGLVVALIRLVQFRPQRIVLDAIAVLLMGYNVIVLTESRLVIAGLFLALIPICLFVLRGGRRIVITILAPLVLIPLVLFVVQRYLGNFQDIGSYLASDVSATFRQYEAGFFRRYFEMTDGLGFGFMSGDPQYTNVLTYAANGGSEEFGKQYVDYAMGLVDIGIWSALYQFGWVGLVLILFMTAVAALRLVQASRLGAGHAATAALGWMMIALMISPLPMNYFTLFYTANIGAVLWFLASEVARDMRRARTAQPVAIDAVAAAG